MDSAVAEAQANKLQLDPLVVQATLVERVTKDCLSATQYIDQTAIIGVLELVKMTIFNMNYDMVSRNISESIRGKAKEQ